MGMVAFVGSFLCLDRSAIQVLVSRPVVVGPFIGFLLGDTSTGLISGAFTELLWINRIRMGAYIPPNDSIMAVCVASVSAMVGSKLGGATRELIAASVLLYVPVGLLGQRIDMFLARYNIEISERVEKYADEGDAGGISRLHVMGLVRTFAGYFMIIAVSLPVGYFILVRVYPLISASLLSALTWIYYLIPLLGISVALATVKMKKAVPLFALFALSAVIFLEFVR